MALQARMAYMLRLAERSAAARRRARHERPTASPPDGLA
jgi:hypothetical protein